MGNLRSGYHRRRHLHRLLDLGRQSAVRPYAALSPWSAIVLRPLARTVWGFSPSRTSGLRLHPRCTYPSKSARRWISWPNGDALLTSRTGSRIPGPDAPGAVSPGLMAQLPPGPCQQLLVAQLTAAAPAPPAIAVSLVLGAAIGPSHCIPTGQSLIHSLLPGQTVVLPKSASTVGHRTPWEVLLCPTWLGALGRLGRRGVHRPPNRRVKGSPRW